MSKTVSGQITLKTKSAREAFREEFAGAVIESTGRQGPYLKTSPDDPTIKRMHDLAVEHGISLRVHMPGTLAPVPLQRLHMNVYLTENGNDGLKVEDNFTFG